MTLRYALAYLLQACLCSERWPPSCLAVDCAWDCCLAAFMPAECWLCLFRKIFATCWMPNHTADKCCTQNEKLCCTLTSFTTDYGSDATQCSIICAVEARLPAFQESLCLQLMLSSRNNTLLVASDYDDCSVVQLRHDEVTKYTASPLEKSLPHCSAGSFSVLCNKLMLTLY